MIRAIGDSIRLSLNDRPSVDYDEEDAGIADDGRIAVQIHAGGPMEVRFRNVLIQPLPTRRRGRRRPRARLPRPGPPRLRAGRTDTASTYPEGYDGDRKFPVVLFLHGSGERGEDGVLPMQVGLGPNIAGRPAGHFPAIAVFPQARETWAAGSNDADRALAALDEVLADYATDPDRVVLTGLSMGGRGTWSIGAADPGRFSALVPICGPGDVETVAAIDDLPVWGFVGDEDRDSLLSRACAQMVRALQDAEAEVRYKEYLGVGHNSWDRAYSEPDLVAWMLDQTRSDD